jgi:hypothetical protein
VQPSGAALVCSIIAVRSLMLIAGGDGRQQIGLFLSWTSAHLIGDLADAWTARRHAKGLPR